MVSHRGALSLLLPSVADSNFKQMKTEPVPESGYMSSMPCHCNARRLLQVDTNSRHHINSTLSVFVQLSRMRVDFAHP